MCACSPVVVKGWLTGVKFLFHLWVPGMERWGQAGRQVRLPLRLLTSPGVFARLFLGQSLV